MQEAVYRVLTLVSALVVDVPIGTNLGLLHLFWMVLCGKLLLSRGAIFPGLSAVGLSEGAVRRAWAAAGAWELDESSAGEAVGAGGRGGGVLAAASARWVSPGRGRHHGVLAATVAGVPDQPLQHDGREGAAGDPAGDHRAGRERGPSSGSGCRWGWCGPQLTDPSPSAHRRVLLKQAVKLQAADRRAGDGSGVHGGAGAGGRGDGLGDAAAEEHDGAAGRAPAVSGAGPTGEVWRPGAPTGAAAQGTGDRRDPAGSGHDVDRTRQRRRPDPARGAVDRVWSCQTPPPVARPSPSSRSTTRPTPSPCWWRRRSRCRHGAARTVPRPLAGRATPARGQTNAGRGPPVRARAGDLPALPGAGAAGRGGLDLRGRDQPGRPNRLLGPPAATHPRTAPAPARAGRFSTRLPLARATSWETGGHRPLAERLLGPTTPSIAHFRLFEQS